MDNTALSQLTELFSNNKALSATAISVSTIIVSQHVWPAIKDKVIAGASKQFDRAVRSLKYGVGLRDTASAMEVETQRDTLGMPYFEAEIIFPNEEGISFIRTTEIETTASVLKSTSDEAGMLKSIIQTYKGESAEDEQVHDSNPLFKAFTDKKLNKIIDEVLNSEACTEYLPNINDREKLRDMLASFIVTDIHSPEITPETVRLKLAVGIDPRKLNTLKTLNDSDGFTQSVEDTAMQFLQIALQKRFEDQNSFDLDIFFTGENNNSGTKKLNINPTRLEGAVIQEAEADAKMAKLAESLCKGLRDNEVFHELLLEIARNTYRMQALLDSANDNKGNPFATPKAA